MAEDAGGLSGVDTATLAPMVRDLLDEPAAVVAAEWSCRPLGGGASEGLGLYRVTGSARVGGATRPWALVCKVCAPANGADPGAWDYPPREPLAYGSGLLAALPGGLAAPRCLAVEAQPDGTTRLWLEAVADAHPGPWPLDRYALVARRLGRFNGAYLAGAPLPDQPWLSRGWLRELRRAVRPRRRRAGAPRRPRRPAVAAAALSAARRRRNRAALDGAGALPRGPGPAAADLLPPRRLPAQPVASGRGRTARTSWPSTGRTRASARSGRSWAAGGGQPLLLRGGGDRPARPRRGLLRRLRGGVAGGGLGRGRTPRAPGLRRRAALRATVGLLRVVLPLVADPALRPVVEDLFGRPLEEVVAAWAELWPLQFGLAEEARALLPAVG